MIEDEKQIKGSKTYEMDTSGRAGSSLPSQYWSIYPHDFGRCNYASAGLFAHEHYALTATADRSICKLISRRGERKDVLCPIYMRHERIRRLVKIDDTGIWHCIVSIHPSFRGCSVLHLGRCKMPLRTENRRIGGLRVIITRRRDR